MFRSTNRRGMDQNEVRKWREKIGNGGKERSKTQLLRSKNLSSEKSKTQILRRWIFSEKNMFFLFSETTLLLGRKKELLFFFGVHDRFLEKNVGSGDPDFWQSAHYQKFGSLEPAFDASKGDLLKCALSRPCWLLCS